MGKWKVQVKEVGNDHVLHPVIDDESGTWDLARVREHLGLEENDIEWYTIERT